MTERQPSGSERAASGASATPVRRLLVDERVGPRGESAFVHVEATETAGRYLVSRGDVALGELSVAMIEAVMTRYGKPLSDEVRCEGPWLALASGARLVHLRHLARYDVVARDYLVLDVPGKEPLAELATAVAAALVHLAEAQARAQASA